MVLRARLQFFAHRKETLAVHLSPVPNLNGVWGAMEQKVHLSPVPVLKPACCLDSSIKRPFYETALTNIRKDRKHPKSGSINSFRQSEFSNQQSHTSKANSNSCLRWFSVPLLPKPLHRSEWRAVSRHQPHETAESGVQRRGARGRDQAKSACCRSSSRCAR